jgi:hypothetical protein
MRIGRGVLGGLLIMIGAVWFLQGVNVLPGSFMTGQTRWAVYGGIAAAAGVGLSGRRSGELAVDKRLWRCGSLRDLRC